MVLLMKMLTGCITTQKLPDILNYDTSAGMFCWEQPYMVKTETEPCLLLPSLGNVEGLEVSEMPLLHYLSRGRISSSICIQELLVHLKGCAHCIHVHTNIHFYSTVQVTHTSNTNTTCKSQTLHLH